MNIFLGLIATSLIIYSQILLGRKLRLSFLVMAAGNALWLYTMYYRSPFQFDLFLTYIIFLVISIRNFFLWGKT